MGGVRLRRALAGVTLALIVLVVAALTVLLYGFADVAAVILAVTLALLVAAFFIDFDRWTGGRRT